jgi:hypothetical protein
MKETTMSNRPPMTPDEEWKYAETALRWHGWGSPVGMGIGLVCLGIAMVLIRLAVLGF